jgi:uncharacterized protein (TIGR01370 family)
MDAMRNHGRMVLSLDRCDDDARVRQAGADADRDHVLDFAAAADTHLDRVPPGHPRHENAAPIDALTQARDWLPMLDGGRYATAFQWMKALDHTNYDVVVVNVMHRGTGPLTKADIAALKYKALGAPRLVLAELPIGLAFDNQWYWKKGWGIGDPSFLVAIDPDRPGAYIANLADPAWEEILGKYISGIMDLGFDGVMFDDVDTFKWFEALSPLPGL